MPIIEEYDINEFIKKLADKLKSDKLVEPLEWSLYVKTGNHKERPPMNNDWWYIRAAAILRSIQKLGPIGVSKLRTKYGGKKNRGHKPSHFYKGSGNIIRKILQQLEKSGLVHQVDISGHKGRMLTKKGKELLKSVGGN
jgi:small subunit ribosomal protein S19e